MLKIIIHAQLVLKDVEEKDPAQADWMSAFVGSFWLAHILLFSISLIWFFSVCH